MPQFTSMAFKSPDELIFGLAKNALKYGLGMEIGAGRVIPELKYWPLREKEQDREKLLDEYKKITSDVLKRAINLGMDSLQLETELNYVATLNLKIAGEITSLRKDIMENIIKNTA